MAFKAVRKFDCSLLLKSGKLKALNRSYEVSSYATIPLKNAEQQNKPDLNRSINDAIKIVGYPTSHLSLHVLLSDEVSNLGSHLRRLVSTNHPLINIGKELIYNGKNVTQTRGLTVLLISKLAGYINSTSECQAEVSNFQRKLSEITEMIHTAHLIHKSVVNLSARHSFEDISRSSLNFGNKIAILSGDYLLANACKALASLQYPKVVELMGCSISDCVESEFICNKDPQDNCLPSPQFQIEDWENKISLSAGSLLSNACRGAMLLAGHSVEVQNQASALGMSIALAWKTHSELQPFLYQDPNSGEFDLASSPVVLFLQSHPQYQFKGIAYDNFDFKSLQREVSNSSAVAKVMDLNHKYTDRAFHLLSHFDESDAKSALHNIILALKEF